MVNEEIGDSDFGFQVGIGFVGEVATAVVGLIGSVILARTIGPSGYGLFYTALAVADFFENPITGWADACKKRMTESEFNDREAVGSVIIVTFALSTIGIPTAYFLIRAFSQNNLLPIMVPVLFVPLSFYWSIKTILSGRNNFSLSMWAKVVRTFVKIILQVVLVLAGLRIWGMVAGAVMSAIITIPVIYYWIGIRPSIPSKDSLLSIAEFAKWSVPNGFVGTSLSKMDIILLGWLVTAGSAGNYRVALTLSMPAIFISSVISSGLMGRVSNLRSRGSEWLPDLNNALSFSSILSIPIFLGSLALGELVITTVYSNEYSGAGLFLVGLTLYQVLVTQTTPLSSVIQGLDRPGLNFRISLIALLINISLGISLWYIYGPVGIVAATVLTQAFSYITRYYFVSKATGRRYLITSMFLKETGSGLIMLIAILWIRRVVSLDKWFLVLLVVLFGAIIYFIILTIISTQFRVTVSDNLKKIS